MSLSGSVLSRTLNIPPERRRKENEEKRAKRGKDKNSSVYTIAKKEFMLPHRRNVHGTCELISPKRITSLNRADSCLVAIHFTFVRKGETVTLLAYFMDCHCIDSIYYHVVFTLDISCFEYFTFLNDSWDISGFKILFFVKVNFSLLRKNIKYLDNFEKFFERFFFFFGSKCVYNEFLLDKFFWNFLWKWIKFYCGIFG